MGQGAGSNRAAATHGGEGGRIVACRGARAAEERLLADLAALLAAAATEPSLLARPVLVVVSSADLRRHVAARIAERLGPSLAVRVTTLWVLAREILLAAGAPPCRGEPLLEVLARRAARAEPALDAVLRRFDDGHGLAVATIRDLLDAGFEPAHERALTARLPAPRDGRRPTAEHAKALVRAAAATARAMAEHGAATTGDLLACAARRLDDGAELGARAVLVHGFADATGRAVQLLDALLARGATIYVDEPPGPGATGATSGPGTSAAVAFARRFVTRLRAGAAREQEHGATPTAPAGRRQLLLFGVAPEPAPPVRAAKAEPPQLALFHACGADAEAREAAYRVRALLDAGTRPEAVTIVARTLEPYAVALRRWLPALGIPFSGNAAPVGLLPRHRRARALLACLRRADAATTDEWLDAHVWSPRTHDLRLAFAVLGAARLEDLVRLPLHDLLGGRHTFPLPARAGLGAVTVGPETGEGSERGDDDHADEDSGDGNGEGGDSGSAPPEPRTPNRSATPATRPAGSPRRSIPATLLEAAVARASRWLALLASWPHRAAAAEHARRLRAAAQLFEVPLDVGAAEDEDDERKRVAGAAALERGDQRSIVAALEALAADVDDHVELETNEALLLLEHHLSRALAEPLGGHGGGVRVLDVTHARALTCEHLFLLGLDAQQFPRTPREDPLLPDDLRLALSPVLPHLAEKLAADDEEHFLFDELLSSAPHVTLSWQRADEDGRARQPSPLVLELLAATPAPAPDEVPRPWLELLRRDLQLGRALPPDQALRLCALGGRQEHFAASLPVAVADARRLVPSPLAPDAEAAARAAVLAALDPDLRERGPARRRRGDASPWQGFVGAPLGDHDPRRGPLFVTLLEAYARCPWQAFVRRMLRLEAAPDPLAALPALTPRLIGNAVHRALQHLVDEPHSRPARGRRERLRTLEEALAAPSRNVPRPEPAAVAAAVQRAAFEVARDEGLHLHGMQRALAQIVAEHVVHAVDVDWRDGPLHVAGAEVQGAVRMATNADNANPSHACTTVHFRADRVDRLGAIVRLTDYKTGGTGTVRTAAKAQQALAQDLQRGARLQAAAYAACGGPAQGRYLYLRPTTHADVREVTLSSEDPLVRERLPALLSQLAHGIGAGAFGPRYDTPDGKANDACRTCEVRGACLRDDSTQRRHMRELLERGDAPAVAAVAALAFVWQLATAGRENATDDAAGETA